MIYVNGDSWSQKNFNHLGTDYSWPSVLQTRLQFPVINESAGCGSNSRCLNNLQKIYQTGTKISLVIIALTSFQRWHFPSRLTSSWSIGPTVVNDRFSNPDNYILDWWNRHVFDEVEFVYQYYNQIWQMHELANKYLKCPVLFFNAWDSYIIEIHKKIFVDNQVKQWLEEKVDDAKDYCLSTYTKSFDFFKTQLPNWNLFINEPWTQFLTNHIDGPDGLHPFHPSPEGHELICDFVCNKIKENKINLNPTV